MATRMLIDAAHPEETRVVVVRGTRLEEFDIESATKQQLKGNIYLAKVTRVEPSLQAAFVDYGGNRHGFLPLNEIHPDYYQVPIADRQALLEHEAAEGAAEVAEEEAEAALGLDAITVDENEIDDDDDDLDTEDDGDADEAVETDGDTTDDDAVEVTPEGDEADEAGPKKEASAEDQDGEKGDAAKVDDGEEAVAGGGAKSGRRGRRRSVEAVGGDELDDVARPRRRPQRRYKIQEVIKRRQILLIQVVREERGNKGAALTTYLSLAGRYCVLMPNTARGGGVSRKITSQTDRKKLKSVIDGLAVPEGMGLIVRTAGQARTKAEIKRDYEYLMRLWDSVRQLTLESTAPCLTYEEANLIKRSIRDLYSKEIDEILVEGEEGYKAAKGFMRMLMPSHAKHVQPYTDRIPLFHRYQVEQQFDSMHSPVVQLKSGGYIVISPTEALVAIDVNSGRSTKERSIEETAYRTNLEAAEEVARQLRLRDLAGLIVIDFIDMDNSRNARNVERRLKEKLKSDRARIQVGRVSPFGLLEMSRQRLRPSLLEASTEVCAHCEGTGVVRSTESSALHVMRAIEEEGIRGRAAEIVIHASTSVALYLLNQKRDTVLSLEERFNLRVQIDADDSLVPPDFRLERVRSHSEEDMPETEAVIAETVTDEEETTAEDSEGQPKKRRRRGKRGGRRQRGKDAAAETAETTETTETTDGETQDEVAAEEPAADAPAAGDEAGANDNAEEEAKPAKRRRRRPRRRKAATTPADVGAEIEGVTPAEAETTEEVKPSEPEAPAEELTEETVGTDDEGSEPAAEAVTEPEPEPVEAVIEEPPMATDDAPLAAAGEIIEPIAATEPENVEPEISEPEISEPAKPARKGWWQRG